VAVIDHTREMKINFCVQSVSLHCLQKIKVMFQQLCGMLIVVSKLCIQEQNTLFRWETVPHLEAASLPLRITSLFPVIMTQLRLWTKVSCCC